MNFILFGPPGVGKSTLIAILKSRNVRAIDLEDVYPSRVRFALPNQLTNVVIGAADLNPKRQYPNAKKILLIADQHAYDQRRAQRDARVSGKASQMHHQVSDWLDGDWDIVIDTSGRKPPETAKRLLTWIKQEGGFDSGTDNKIT